MTSIFHLNFRAKFKIQFVSCLGIRVLEILGLPGLGGSFGAFERSSDFAVIVLSSPPNGDSRLTRLRFSIDDFFTFDLLSASWIRLEILEGGR